MKPTSIAEYIATLTEKQGVAVASVSDGWVMVFTRSKLQSMLDTIDSSESDKLAIFIKSGAGVASN